MTMRIGSIVFGVLTVTGASGPAWAAGAVPSQSFPLCWVVAVLGVVAVVAAGVIGWRYHRLHGRMERVMDEMGGTLGELRDRIGNQTTALEWAGRQLEHQRHVIEDLRLTDSVTGLWTRKHVFRLLETHCARALRTWVGWNAGGGGNAPENADVLIFIVGLDKLEEATVALGDSVVDAVLREFADVLRASSRSTDILARWGESEFMVVRSGAQRDSARGLAERLRESVGSHIFKPDDELELSTSCSIGFAGYPFLTHAPQALGWESVVDLARTALDVARRRGRDSWVGLLGDASTPSEGLQDMLEEGPQDLIDKGRLQVVTSWGRADDLQWNPQH